MENKPGHTDVWRLEHAGLSVEINHFGVDTGMNDGKGRWTYYVFIHESKTKKFNEIWLPAIVKPWSLGDNSMLYCSYDYYRSDLLNSAYWHGGITYYSKRGDAEGFRCIQVGCDFGHLYDMERGHNYKLEDILVEARETAEQLAKVLEVANDNII